MSEPTPRINQANKQWRMFDESCIDTYWELLGKEAEMIGTNDHLLQELPLLIELARRGALDLSEAITKQVALDADAIIQALVELEHFGSELRMVIVN